MKTKREINGYIAIYLPEHPKAYNNESGNWTGWYYEHRHVAEVTLGRYLNDCEIVHHLDCNKQNNNPANLIVLADKSSHIRLHYWIDAGSNTHESYVQKTATHFGKPKPLCLKCKSPVTEHGNIYCSYECSNKGLQKVERPSKIDLIKIIEDIGYVQTGRLYKVSDTAVRKWLKAYNIDPRTIKKRN